MIKYSFNEMAEKAPKQAVFFVYQTRKWKFYKVKIVKKIKKSDLMPKNTLFTESADKKGLKM